MLSRPTKLQNSRPSSARAEHLAEENRANLYAARIKVAEQSYKEGGIEQALTMLDSLRPQTGQEDLRSFDWFYLQRLCQKEALNLGSHTGKMYAVKYSPDGRTAATAGEDRIIRLWNASNRVEVAQLHGHTGRVVTITFNRDGTKLVSAGEDSAVRVWDVDTASEIRTLRSDAAAFTSVAISPDDALVAGGEGTASTGAGNPFTAVARSSDQGRIVVWRVEEPALQYTVAAHSWGVRALSFSPDGRKLASGGIDNQVKLFDATAGSLLATETNFPGPVFALAFSPNGERIATASWLPYRESGSIYVLNAETLERDRVFPADVGPVMCLAFSPDGIKLASGGDDRLIRLWDFSSGDELGMLRGHTNTIISLAFTPDGKSLASAGWDNQVKVWNLEESPIRQRIQTTNGFSLAFSPDSQVLACSARGVVELRDARYGRLVRRLTEYTNEGDMRVVFSPDGRTLAATAYDGMVHFWDTKTWQHWTPAKEDSETWADIPMTLTSDSHFAFSPDSRLLAMPGYDRIIRIWEARSGKLVDSISDYTNFINAVSYTPDGMSLILGTSQSGKFLDVWDISARRRTTSIAETAGVLRVSKNGRWLASGTWRAGINVRDLASMRIRFNLLGHRNTIYCVTFSHDNRLIATASWDGTVKLWHTATGQELLTIPSHVGVVWSVAFSPDDRTLAFGCGSGAAARVVILRASD